MARKGYLLATASTAAAVAAAGAQAADMPVKAPPRAPVAVPTWAGWYIGLNAGANWQHSSDSFGYAGGAPPGNAQPKSSGFIGGGQIGYNWQNGNLVYGLEGDISGLSGRSHASVPVLFGFPSKAFSNQIKWLSTVRARIGLTFGDATMVYATGGVAVGGVKNSFLGSAPPFICCNKSVSSTRVGWAAGGGIEHMLWDSHWTVGLEGLFVDLGKTSATGVGPNGQAKTAKFNNRAAIARLKLNYKF